MPVPELIALIVGAWTVVGVLVAFVVGRAAAAGEHERQIGAMHRAARRADGAFVQRPR